MENRLLVAFVLSLGVFIGWGYIMSMIEGPPPSQVELEKQLADVPSSVNPGISQQASQIGKPKPPLNYPVPPRLRQLLANQNFQEKRRL